MFEILRSICEVVIIVTSVYLIISGFSKKDKNLSIKSIKKRNLVFGIVLLVSFLIASLPDMKNGFIGGWNVATTEQTKY